MVMVWQIVLSLLIGLMSAVALGSHPVILLLVCLALAIFDWFAWRLVKKQQRREAMPTRPALGAPAFWVDRRADQDSKRCPDCAEFVRAEARVCKHCGYRFAPAPLNGHPAR
jgi:hypothetical protein